MTVGSTWQGISLSTKVLGITQGKGSEDKPHTFARVRGVVTRPTDIAAVKRQAQHAATMTPGFSSKMIEFEADGPGRTIIRLQTNSGEIIFEPQARDIAERFVKQLMALIRQANGELDLDEASTAAEPPITSGRPKLQAVT